MLLSICSKIIEKIELCCSFLVYTINFSDSCTSDQRQYAFPSPLEKNGVLWNYSYRIERCGCHVDLHKLKSLVI